MSALQQFIQWCRDNDILVLGGLLAVLGTTEKASEFVSAIEKAKQHEQRKQSGSALGWYREGEAAGWIASVVGAVVLLALYGLVKGRAGR